jgi:hypothetical protein
MSKKKLPKKYQLIAVNEDDSIKVLKEAVSLESLSISDINPGYFPVAFVAKDDIVLAYRRHGGRLSKTMRNTINSMIDVDMVHLADLMQDRFRDTEFWDSITDNMELFVEQYHASVRNRLKWGTPP